MILLRQFFRYMGAVILLLLLLISPVHAASRQFNSIDLIDRAHRSGQIKYNEALNYKVTAILRPESLPVMYRSNGIIKSATFVLMEARLNRHLLSSENERLLARGRGDSIADLYNGIIPRSFASPQGRFRIHYTTDNKYGDAVPALDINEDGVPDYVERFAEILDHVWTTEVEQMGYDAPPSDGIEGGDCLLDVYLADEKFYGLTQIDVNDPAANVYMIFENDFSVYFMPNSDPEGDVIGAMKATAAHEFFHTIQFQITEDLCTNGWWMEASSTWMEDYVYPEVNDYINFIDYWFQNSQLPIDTYDCTGNDTHRLFHYGTTIWIKHMTEKYGSELVFDVWDKMKTGKPHVSALSAVIGALKDRGISLEEELKELRVANVTMTYEDAVWYKSWQSVSNAPDSGPIEVKYSRIYHEFSSSVAFNDFLLPLAAKYYFFSAPQVSGNLSINFSGSGNTSVMVIGLNADDTAYDVTEILTDANHAGSITINGFGASGNYSRIVLIPVNYTDAVSESFFLSAAYTTANAGNISSVDIRPDSTSLVTGDNGINGRQQYHLIMTDENNRQVLQAGTIWTDNSSYINIDRNGLAVLTGTDAGAAISASILTHTASSSLTSASPAAVTPGTPRACAATNNSIVDNSRCFIATAAFGSPLHPFVILLREFRDVYLLSNTPGRWIVSLYYSSSPPIAEIISDNSGLKVIVKLFLIPAIMISWVLLKTTLIEKIIAAVLMFILIRICPVKY